MRDAQTMEDIDFYIEVVETKKRLPVGITPGDVEEFEWEDIIRESKIIEGGKEIYQKALQVVRYLVSQAMEDLSGIGENKETQIELGVKFASHGGIILANSPGESGLKISIKWKDLPSDK